jgi:hypothetical protein
MSAKEITVGCKTPEAFDIEITEHLKKKGLLMTKACQNLGHAVSMDHVTPGQGNW